MRKDEFEQLKKVVRGSHSYDSNKFGTKEFFESYLLNQLKKDGDLQEVIHRVHFALTSLIFEITPDQKSAFTQVKLLTATCEKHSDRIARVGYL